MDFSLSALTFLSLEYPEETPLFSNLTRICKVGTVPYFLFVLRWSIIALQDRGKDRNQISEKKVSALQRHKI